MDFARDRHLPISVKGGGHDVAGNAVGEGRSWWTARARRTSGLIGTAGQPWLEAGALLADLDSATQAYGLATPLGVVSVTGIAGLTLGGGIGWLNGKFGLACDNVLSAEIVTSDGELLTVSSDHHPDLYWAVRGGGGISAWSPRSPTSCSRGDRHCRRTLVSARADEGGSAALSCIRRFLSRRTLDVGQSWPGRLRSPCLRVGLCWSGNPEELDAALPAAARPRRRPVADDVADGYCALQSAHDGGFPRGQNHYWKSSFFSDLTDDAVDTLLHFAAEMPSPASGIGMQQLHGVAARVDPSATAFPHRRPRSELLILGPMARPRQRRNATWAGPAPSLRRCSRSRLAAFMQRLGRRGGAG